MPLEKLRTGPGPASRLRRIGWCYDLELMSPTVFRDGAYRFFFFSREEPRMHVHVASSEGEAKFWIEPMVELADRQRRHLRS